MLEYDLVIEHCGHRLRMRGTEEQLSVDTHSLRSAWHFLRLWLRYRRHLAKLPALRICWKGIRIR